MKSIPPMFCTRRLFRRCAAAGLFLLLAVSGLVQAQIPGFVEGNLKFISFEGVKKGDDDAAEHGDSGARSNYAKYPLLILSSDGQKEIKRFIADADGHYKIALPPGNYVLEIQDPGQKRPRSGRRPFAVQSGETVEVNIVIGPGFF